MFIYLDIVRDFACARCGRCCCNEWLVTVDAPLYRSNAELFARNGRSEEFCTAYQKLSGPQAPGEYAAIAKQRSGGCWFLSRDNLCRLQRELGHERLSNVCQLFPRYPMSSARGVELTLSFSCPEVVRLASREPPLAVVRAEQPPAAFGSDDFVAGVFPQQQSLQSPLRYYFELEHHFIDIMQCRRLTLAERINFLRRTVSALCSIYQADSMGRDIDRIIRENYLQLDAITEDADELRIADCLLENFFVNLIFKKIFYLYGLERAMHLLQDIWRKIAVSRGGVADSATDLQLTRAAVMDFEFQYIHNRRTLLAR